MVLAVDTKVTFYKGRLIPCCIGQLSNLPVTVSTCSSPAVWSRDFCVGPIYFAGEFILSLVQQSPDNSISLNLTHKRVNSWVGITAYLAVKKEGGIVFQ